MKRFEYANEEISEREVLIAVPSMVISVGILTLPKSIAADTIGPDGWIIIVVGGLLALFMAWVISKIASSFPEQSFISYASQIASKPVAIILTFLHALIAVLITAFQIRQIAHISKEYLFEITPIEVISLSFFLVVIYAVSGSRIGLFRLNMLFLPLILLIAVTVLFFNVGVFEMSNIFPMFKSSPHSYIKGIGNGVTSYAGIGILWFYIVHVKNPKKVPKMAAIGMIIPIILYTSLYIVCIGVFGNSVTSNLLFPTVELAKEVSIPGEFFERFESIFFVIWIMAIFNTTAMAFDVSVFALRSIFKNTQKIRLILILAPITFFIAMFPRDMLELSTFGEVVGYAAFGFTIFVAVLLIGLAKIRGVKLGE